MPKIAEIDQKGLEDAMKFMAEVPTKDKHFTGWNFDSGEWEHKYQELIKAARKIADQKG